MNLGTRWVSLVAAATFTVAAPPLLAQLASGYSVQDLGPVPDESTHSPGGFRGFQINEANEIIGYTYGNSGGTRAAIWRQGTLIQLGTLPQGSNCQGSGLNNRGDAVGSCQNQTMDWRPVLWRGGQVIELWPFTNQRQEGAVAINDVGEVAGQCWPLVPGRPHACLWRAGTLTDLGALPGGLGSWATHINAVGHVAGRSDCGAAGCWGEHAFLWVNGTLTDLGALPFGDWESVASALNDHDQVVGSSAAQGSTARGFLWDKGVLRDLGTLGGPRSVGIDINNAGMIAGWAEIAPDVAHATVYVGAAWHDLNALIGPSSGWELVAAEAINDRGAMVGYGRLGGNMHTFLLQPVVENIPALYWPGILALATALGGLAMLALRRA